MTHDNDPAALTATVVVDLGRFLTRTITDDGWEVVDPAYIDCWKSARSLMSKRIFKFDGYRVKCEVNWSPVIRRLQTNFRVMTNLTKSGTKQERNVDFPLSSVRVAFNATAERIGATDRVKDGSLKTWLCSFVQYFLYDFFLIMNVAYPSSCNFYNAIIFSDYKFLNEELRLASVDFEIAFLDSKKRKWPQIGFIPLKQVMDWFFSVRAELKLVPTNRMERVLFAILHISRSDASPTSVIWIFYALETLFDTRAGENFSVLISRIQLLLCFSPAQLRLLKKNMRKLYDLRSAFVHGGLDVMHPYHNELLDGAIDDVFDRLMDAVGFGFAIILASVQETIRRGWREPNFAEILVAGS